MREKFPDGMTIDTVFDSFCDTVYRLAYSRTGNRFDAEDVLHLVVDVVNLLDAAVVHGGLEGSVAFAEDDDAFGLCGAHLGMLFLPLFLALPLLVARVRADYAHDAFTAYDAAVLANATNRTTYFHCCCLLFRVVE